MTRRLFFVVLTFSFTIGASAQEKVDERAKARVKAEAEAAAKNEANRKAYEAEVELAKVEHEKKLENYQADKQAYQKAILVYDVAKKELEAAKLLTLARNFDNPKQREIAERRFREITQLYPATQAAKDATVLLKGDFVPRRELPTEPVRPKAPAEPRLVLPPGPAQVRVVYPPEAIDPSSDPSVNSKQPPPVVTNKKPPQPNNNKSPGERPLTDDEKAAVAATAVGGMGICTILAIAIGVMGFLLAEFLPIAICLYRGHPNTLPIALINLFFGWTCIGWFIALIWSVSAISEPASVNIVVR